MTFRPMLAAEHDPEKFPIRFPVLASPKIDGIRCVIRHGQPLTRSLKPIPNRHIRAALAGLPDFDGELIVGDPLDPKAWNNTSSAVMSHDGEPNFTYYVFDGTSLQTDMPYENRLAFALRNAEMFGPRIVGLVHRWLYSIEDLIVLENEYVRDGYEGIMIRDPMGPYKWGRSTAKEGLLLKIKRFDDLEAVILYGEERQTHIGQAKTNALGLTERDHKKENFVGAGDLGGLVCTYHDSTVPLVNKICGTTYASDIEFTVGSGFTAEQRIALWADRNNLPGKTIKVKHQGFTVEHKPRFPIFQGFRDERDMG